MKTPMLLVATALVLTGAAPPEGPPPAPARPLPGLPELASEVGEQAVHGAETSGLPQAIPASSPEAESPAGRFRFSAEYLYWWLRDAPTPVPLATIRPSGAGDTTALTTLGPGLGNFDPFSGARLGLAVWLDDNRLWAAEADGFLLERRHATNSLGSDAALGIDRPLDNALNGRPLFVPVSVPGFLSGVVTASTSIEFGGAGAQLAAAVVNGPVWHVDLLAGYRYLDLRERLDVVQQSQAGPGDTVDTRAFGPLVNGAALSVSDHFATENHFHGGLVGARTQWSHGSVYLDVTGKAGVGVTHQFVNAVGTSTVTPAASGVPGVAEAAGPGGLLVQPTNAGVTVRDRATFLGEVGVTAGAQVTTYLRLYLGYSLLYWDGVVRPGNQIDPVLNPAQLPLAAQFQPGAGPARPVVPFRLSEFWAQGLTFGMEWSF